MRLQDHTDEFLADNDVPFSYAIVLFQDQRGGLPDADTVTRYDAAIGAPSFPVLADPTAAVLSATEYRGDVLPGKCVLSPEMEILACYTGDDDTEGFDAITAHAAR